jgi:hypothetical protein
MMLCARAPPATHNSNANHANNFVADRYPITILLLTPECWAFSGTAAPWFIS